MLVLIARVKLRLPIITSAAQRHRNTRCVECVRKNMRQTLLILVQLIPTGHSNIARVQAYYVYCIVLYVVLNVVGTAD